MKTVYAGIFLCSAVILGLSSLWTLKKKTRSAAAIRGVMLSFITPALATAVIAATSSQTVSHIAYALYSLSITWALLSLLRFCLIYAKFARKAQWLLRTCIAASALDSALLLVLVVCNRAFVITQRLSANGEPFFHQTFLAPAYLHLAICYALVLLCIAVLAIRMVRIPSIYWAKYVTAIAFIIFAASWNALYVICQMDVNAIAVSFIPAGTLFTYFALFYKPRLLIDRMLKRIVDQSDDLVFFFDIDRECIYVNQRARDFFGIAEDALYLSGIMLTDWLEDTDFDWTAKNGTYLCTRLWHGETTHLKFYFGQLTENGRTLGEYFHIHNITEEVAKYETQRYAATHDSLTGLYNRDYLYQRIHRELAEHPDTDYYVFVSDIKGFKLINDIFGRQVGDDVLTQSAKIFRAHLGDRALYGRITNDRFCLLLTKPQLDNLRFLENQEVISHLSCGTYYPIVVHGGVYQVRERNMPVTKMIDHAAMALQSIKQCHNERVAFYTEEMREAMLWERRITAELEDAISERQFEIYLQPQADAAGVVRGAEVLIRWNHPDKGVLSPGLFVQVLEKNGLITKMDLFVWEEACRLLQRWKQMGREDFYLSVNISPNDFYYVDVHKTFTELAKKYDINPKNLKLEITETVMITDIDRKVALIDQLHESGFAVEMDDFGSGYSSLNMLKDIPVDVLKIDMAFLYHAKDVKRSQIIIEQVVVLSKELGIPVITEGVETEEQVAFLRGIGCDMFQGYYFAKPLPVPIFEERYFGNNGAKQYA